MVSLLTKNAAYVVIFSKSTPVYNVSVIVHDYIHRTVEKLACFEILIFLWSSILHKYLTQNSMAINIWLRGALAGYSKNTHSSPANKLLKSTHSNAPS